MIAFGLLLGIAGVQPIASPCAGLADAKACEAAIDAAADSGAKSHLLYERAYALNETQHYQEALKDLDRAVELDSSNAPAAHERGYTLNAVGRYADALKQLDRDVKLSPTSPDPYRERAFSRHLLADFEGEYADRDKVVKLSPDDGSALLGRSHVALWLGRFDQAEADANEAERKGKTEEAGRQRKQIALWRTQSGSNPAASCREADKVGSFDRPKLIGDCTAAFLAEPNPPDRAEFLTLRSTAWLVAEQNQNASTEDRQIAAALDPDNPDRHANLGFAYLSASHSWAAVKEFDRALAGKELWYALAGRAAAKHNLKDIQGAFADAKRSFELKPNELALTTLGDLDHERGDDKSARLYWMGAYHLGDRGDDLLERLKSIGVDHPEQEPRK